MRAKTRSVSSQRQSQRLPPDLLALCFWKSRELTPGICALSCHLACTEKYLRVSKAHFWMYLWRCLWRRLTKERRHWDGGHRHIGWGPPQEERKRRPDSVSTPTLCSLALGQMNSSLLSWSSEDYTSSWTRKHGAGQADMETSDALSLTTRFFSLSCLCQASLSHAGIRELDWNQLKLFF